MPAPQATIAFLLFFLALSRQVASDEVVLRNLIGKDLRVQCHLGISSELTVFLRPEERTIIAIPPTELIGERQFHPFCFGDSVDQTTMSYTVYYHTKDHDWCKRICFMEVKADGVYAYDQLSKSWKLIHGRQ